MTKKFRIILLVGLILYMALALTGSLAYAGLGNDVEPVPIEKQPTDPTLLKLLHDRGIDKRYVEVAQDYNSASPYSKIWADRKSNRRFLEVSQLPRVDASGGKIKAGWEFISGKYQSGNGLYNNLFAITVDNSAVIITIKNDQPDGRKAGATLQYSPTLYFNGKEVRPHSQPILLAVDPYNPNYTYNVIEWDYGICTRVIRIIEGTYREWWEFPQDPNGEIKIVHNQVGDYKLMLGQYAVDDDIEVVPASEFKKYDVEYPFTISASDTFYHNSGAGGVDGQIWADAFDTWTNLRTGIADNHNITNNVALVSKIYSWTAPATWVQIARGAYTFDTSALPDTCTVNRTVFSLYGSVAASTATYRVDACAYHVHLATSTNLTNADFQLGAGKFETTPISDNITYAAWNLAGYNDFEFNAYGLTTVNVTGYTYIGTADPLHDIPDNPPAFEASKYSYLQAFTFEKGAGFLPTLYVEYSMPKPLAPTNFDAAQIGTNTANLTWTMGVGATNTLIRGSTSRYPTDITDGYPVAANTTGTAFNSTGLSLTMETYYYSAWSWADGEYSVGYATTSIGGGSMIFLGLIALAGVVGFMAIRSKNILVGLASTLTWVFILFYTRDNPIVGVTIGSNLDNFFIFLCWAMAIAIPIITFMQYRGETKLKRSGFLTSDSGIVQAPPEKAPRRGLMDLSTSEYRRYIRSKMHNRTHR